MKAIWDNDYDSRTDSVYKRPCCPEYVSKKEVILALLDKGQRSTRYKWGDSWELNLFEIQEAIDNMPAADVEPVRHGRWEDYYVGDRQEEGVICTVCKELCKCEFDYCPNCGAKMDGGERE